MCQSNRVPTRGILGKGGEVDERVEVVHFGTYNIQNSHNGGLELALRGIYQANFDLVLLQDTKITDGVYAQDSTGFSVVTSDALIRHHGGLTLFYKESPRFEVEYHQQQSTNVISFQLVMGGQHWHVVGCHLVSRNASTLESIVTAINHRPRSAELLVVGDFNTALESPYCNKYAEVITVAMTT